VLADLAGTILFAGSLCGLAAGVLRAPGRLARLALAARLERRAVGAQGA
jgi:hypothetical protein